MPTLLDLKAGEHWWCSCGASGHQPLCDGSHKGTGRGPLKFRLPEDGKVWLCDCQRTGNPPYCDGTHNKPVEERGPGSVKAVSVDTDGPDCAAEELKHFNSRRVQRSP